MEFLEGESLSNVIARKQWFSHAQAGEFLYRILRLLRYANPDGFISQSITSENITVTIDGVAKLNDTFLTQNPILLIDSMHSSIFEEESEVNQKNDMKREKKTNIYSELSNLYKKMVGINSPTCDV